MPSDSAASDHAHEQLAEWERELGQAREDVERAATRLSKAKHHRDHWFGVVRVLEERSDATK